MTKTAKRTRITEDWQPSPNLREFAEGLGVDPDAACGCFVDHHLAHGNLMASWDAAWRLWCRNEVKFGRARGVQTPPLLAAAVGPDPYGVRAWAAGLPDAEPGQVGDALVPCIEGYDVGGLACDVCEAAGLPKAWRGNLWAVVGWLRGGIGPDAILAGVRASKKPADIKSLGYFDAAVREARR